MTGAAAIIINGVVTNCIVTEEDADEASIKAVYAEDVTVVFYDPAKTHVGPGYLYDGKKFSPPPLSAEEVAFNNNNIYASSMYTANQKISQLTDATDPDIVDEVDPADVELLKQWKRYRLALLKVDISNPVWPEIPA